MTTVLLPPEIEDRLRPALEAAGEKEIGGILMGECLTPGVFRIVDVSIQKRRGSFSRFVRGIADALVALKQFFSRTRHDYQRFNYLGEWHSHPSFHPIPSQTDMDSMQEMVEDKAVGAHFLVLLIIRLGGSDLQATATVFQPSMEPMQATLSSDEAT